VLATSASREEALASFATAPPRRASGAKELETGLTLAEEILLLALEDDEGRFIQLPEHALPHALAGAVLVDLCQHGRIDCDLERIRVVDARPVGDAVLDPALAALARAGAAREPEHWVRVLARQGDEIRRRVVERLVERKVLRRKDSLLHWVLGGRRYPLVDGREQREIRERVLAVLRNGEVPGPREVAIVALADACAVFDALFGLDEMLDMRARIAEVARMDLVAQAMTRALQEAQSALSARAPSSERVYERAADAGG
jgi:hypothetical protein